MNGPHSTLEPPSAKEGKQRFSLFCLVVEVIGTSIIETRTAIQTARSVRFIVDVDHGRIIRHPTIKNDSGAILGAGAGLFLATV